MGCPHHPSAIAAGWAGYQSVLKSWGGQKLPRLGLVRNCQTLKITSIHRYVQL